MNRIIAALLLLFTSNLFAAPDFDARFAAISIFAKEVDGYVRDWNAHCGDGNDSTTEDCVRNKQILFEQIRLFILIVQNYKAVGDTCIATVANKAVAHDVKVCQWNLKCLGASKLDKIAAGCEESNLALEAELAEMTIELVACAKQKGL